MSKAVDIIQLDNNTRVEVYPDSDPANPREEWDNLGTMVCFHSRYDLGDKKHGFDSPQEVMDYIKENRAIGLFLYAYEHGGITIRASEYGNPFYCPWDSGMVGIIFMTYEKIRKEYGWKYVTAARAKKIQEYLKNEVEVYDDYLTGAVYEYKTVCNQCESELERGWGYYGYDHEKSGLLEAARESSCEDCAAITERLESITA